MFDAEDIRKMEDVSGRVIAIIHSEMKTGYLLLRIESNGASFVIMGQGDAVVSGDSVNAHGYWDFDARWGRCFKARYIHTEIIASVAGIVRFIAAGNVPGVSAKFGKKLADRFGDRLPSLMDMPTTLMSAGISEIKARKISERWMHRHTHGRLMSLFHTFPAGPAILDSIVERYGAGAMAKVMTEIYTVARETRGFSFSHADAIALSQGGSRTDPERIKAALFYCVESIVRNGHCAIGKVPLIAEAVKLLLVPESLIESVLETLLTAGDLAVETIGGRDVVYSRSMRDCEEEVAHAIAERRMSIPLPAEADIWIEDVCRRIGLPPLHEGQTDAVKVGLANTPCVITGNPGTGKTSTVAVLLSCMSEVAPNAKIALAAPTGRAAQRLAESTGCPASTIHRLLEWSPERRGFLRDLDNPLDIDVLIVDESSMLDIWLARSLLRALPSHTRLVIVGDVDQLPSVGAGNVLADIIDSGIIAVARLTKIFRQGAGSGIALASKGINRGVIPLLVNERSDMWARFVDEPEDIMAELETLVLRTLPARGVNVVRDLQILTPGHQGEAGTIRVNAMMQAWLNPPVAGEPVIDDAGRQFRQGDRVIQNANNHDMEIYNGDIGTVKRIAEDGEEMVVDFDGRIVTYERRDLDQLRHAWCITIHKSQGSEFPAVIVLFTTAHHIMLRRNLAYTGISRAKSLCCVLGQYKAFARAVKWTGSRRLTGLASRLTAKAA